MLEESQEPLTRVESVHNRKTERASEGKIRQFNVNRWGIQQLRWRRNPGKLLTLICSALALMIALTIAPTAVLAGGGNVLPGPAKPKGYSLSDMARATAFFNTGDHSLETYPHTPFQILYVPKGGTGPGPFTFEVNPGTMLYVPIFLVDDSPPIPGDFPDVNNRQAVLNYFYSPAQIGTLFMRIVVDGTVNSLGSDYVVGVGNVKLADGPGTRYIVPAAFLTPLNKGTHTVQILAKATGAAIGGVFPVSETYTVIVRDED
jgi:hypothetical protein